MHSSIGVAFAFFALHSSAEKKNYVCIKKSLNKMGINESFSIVLFSYLSAI